MAPYHILIVIISSVIPENLVLLTKSEQSGPKSAHICPTSSQNVESVELGFQIQIVSGILDSLSFIPDSKVQNSRFHKQKLPTFWDLDSLTWGDLSLTL